VDNRLLILVSCGFPWETWGKSIVQQLASDLQCEFPGISGFSASNLWRMKSFYETYRDSEKLAPLVREIA